ncbi:MAG TPA: iron-sulfur cluster assembly scaffold protein, partial [Anaerolineaceae bacterium]|nr:iron-sulfur cluster assembly scaffold protein [Anaerolineaceae bacterium]
YKNPGYRGELDPHDISFEDENPLCGDHLRIDLRVDAAGVVTEAAFSGHGCAISQASADLLLESIIGKTLDDVRQLTKDDLLELLGIELGPVRLKCALLSLKVLKAGVYGLGEAPDSLVED